MSLKKTGIFSVVVTASLCAVAAAESPGPDDPHRVRPPALGDGLGVAPGHIDPLRFFEELVGRYRCLTVYRDSVHVVRVIDRYGEEASRTETQINCEIVEGELRVRTPGSQLIDTLGLDLPLQTGETVENARRRRDLTLAPHMALKFAEEPLDGMRQTGTDTLTPTEAAPVQVNDRTMVQLQLRTGDGLSADCEAKFDLLVDPESMLIERITGEERLPDGATQQTTMSISPEQGRCGAPPVTTADDPPATGDAGKAAGGADKVAPPDARPRDASGPRGSVGA